VNRRSRQTLLIAVSILATIVLAACRVGEVVERGDPYACAGKEQVCNAAEATAIEVLDREDPGHLPIVDTALYGWENGPRSTATELIAIVALSDGTEHSFTMFCNLPGSQGECIGVKRVTP
jgi:hypothetical protein